MPSLRPARRRVHRQASTRLGWHVSTPDARRSTVEAPPDRGPPARLPRTAAGTGLVSAVRYVDGLPEYALTPVGRTLLTCGPGDGYRQ